MNKLREDFTPTVLVVDDNPVARTSVVRAIAELGANIIEADNGRSALSILKKQSVNLVISDLVMPKMSGMMLLHSLLEQGRYLPFIIVTSYSDKDSAVQALRLGAFDYIEKPVDPDDLRMVAQEAIQAGLEQQSLLALMNTQSSQSQESFALAEMQILRMRTFRPKQQEFEGPITKGTINNWYDLRNLFVSEAEQQLIFCQSTLDSMNSENPNAQDLGFLLRTVQSIRLASESIRLTDIAEFAWSMELNLAAFKAAPEFFAPEHVKLIRSAIAILQSKVAALVANDAMQIQRHLERITNEIRSKELMEKIRKTSA